MMDRTVTIYKQGTHIGGKVVVVPNTWEEFLNLVSSKLQTRVTKFYNASGFEIETISNGDVLYAACEDVQEINKIKNKGKKKDKTLDDIIELNVGGKLFTTTRATLLNERERHSKFFELFSLRNDSTDESKPYFMDRSPTYFEYILDYLRGYKLVFSDNFTLESVKNKANYFALHHLIGNWDTYTKLKGGKGKKETNIIKLNVGGKFFTTLRSTLVKEPNSMLAKLLDESAPSETDGSGTFFIDRNPIYFEYILSYLRGEEILFKDQVISKNVLKEAELFGLDSLVKNWHSVTSFVEKCTSRSDLVEIINKRTDDQLKLQYYYFNNADLTGINFENIDFQSASFENCRLVAVTFDVNCNLIRASFKGAFLDTVVFNCEKLYYINFENSIVQSESFGVRSFDYCEFANAKIDGIDVIETPKSIFSDFSNANFQNFSASQILNCYFKNSTWTGANFFYKRLRNCDFTGAVFNGIRLDNVVVEKCNFTNADFSHSFLSNFNFSDENCLQDAIFDTANLTKCKIYRVHFLHHSNCRSVQNKFTMANFTDAVFSYCDINLKSLQKAKSSRDVILSEEGRRIINSEIVLD